MPVMEKERTHSAPQPERAHRQLREQGGLDGRQLSAASVRRTHAVRRDALQQGVRWGCLASPHLRMPQLVSANPAEVVRLIEGEYQLVHVGRKVNA